MAVSKLKNLLVSKWGRTFLSVALFAILTLLIFRNYLNGGGFLVGSDAMGPIADLEMMKVDNSYFSCWRSYTSLGYPNYPSPSLGIIYYLTMEVMNLDPSTVWKGLIMLFFWLAGFLMYVCAYRITGNYIASLVAGLAYLFNQVFLSQVTEMHHFFIMGYALFPLLFLLLYLALRRENRWAVLVLPAFALLYGTIGAPNTIEITSLFLILFILTYALLLFRKSKTKVAYSLVVGSITIFLVLLPMILVLYSGSGYSSWGIHYTIEEAGTYSSYSIYHSFVMASSENTFIFGSPIGQWTILGWLWPLGLAVAIIIPLIALSALKVTSRKHLLISLLIPVLAFIIIANGPNPPDGQIFTLAFQTIPFMDSIRVYSRFHLLTGFAFALMIAIVLAHFSDLQAEMTFPRTTWGKIKRGVFSDRKILCCLIIFVLVFPSSAILSGEIRSFDLPASYAQPYEWVKAQEGDFRVLNLPFQRVYYTQDLERYDGYPGTMTLDVGMYSPVISDKPFAFGVETQNYWSFLGSTLQNKEFGYRDISGFLGGTSSVRYIVSQVQTDPNETLLFSSLNDTHQSAAFQSGGSIIENGQWEPRVHALGKLCVVTGGMASMPIVTGLGLADPAKDGIILLSQLGNESTREEVLSNSNMLVVMDGDLTELASEAGLWKEGELMSLADLGDVHTTDAKSSWISSSSDYVAGYTVQPTVNTSGENQLSMTLNAKTKDYYDIMIRAMYGPDAGLLNISVDSNLVASVRPYSDHPHAGWIEINNLQLNASNHQITLRNDGSGENSLEKLIFASRSQVTDTMNETTAFLKKYQDKVVYAFSASQTSRWNPGTAFGWEGDQGAGISNLSVYLPRDLTGDLRIDDDNRTANGETARIWPGANATAPLARQFSSGSSYTAQIRLAATDNTSSSCLLVVKDENGKLIANKFLSRADLNSLEYVNSSLTFSVPNGTQAIQFEIINTGGSSVLLDHITVSNNNAPNPKLVLDLPLEGNYTLGIAAEKSSNSSDQRVAFDGTQYTSEANGGSAKLQLGNLSMGAHTIDFQMGNLYGLFLAPSNESFSPISPEVSFQRQSNNEYTIKTSSNQPMWLLVSESYNPLWDATIDGHEILHVQANSLVNAYYIPNGGNHTVEVSFRGQDSYVMMQLELLAALVLCTALLIILGNQRLGRWFRAKGEAWRPRLQESSFRKWIGQRKAR